MLQPFEFFKPNYPQMLRTSGNIFIVSQTYTRAKQRSTTLLLSDYKDVEFAKVHVQALHDDPYAAIIDLSKPKHFEKITEMLAVNSPYVLYWNVVSDRTELQRKVAARYRDAIRKYILTKTNWKIKGDETLATRLQVVFGEIFIILSHGTQKIRVKFEDIEKA